MGWQRRASGLAERHDSHPSVVGSSCSPPGRHGHRRMRPRDNQNTIRARRGNLRGTLDESSGPSEFPSCSRSGPSGSCSTARSACATAPCLISRSAASCWVEISSRSKSIALSCGPDRRGLRERPGASSESAATRAGAGRCTARSDGRVPLRSTPTLRRQSRRPPIRPPPSDTPKLRSAGAGTAGRRDRRPAHAG